MAKTIGGRWEIINAVAEGGQGQLFEVRDLRKEFFGFRLVLKRLKNHDRIGRFEREIAAAKRLDHESIPKVVDFSLEGDPFFVTEYIDGNTLEAAAPLQSLEALRVFRDLCLTVDYAHNQDVIHRDLKPTNIMLDHLGRLHVLDFGLCFFCDEADDRLTDTMEGVGSRFYIAPEMALGRADEVTGAADVYALGKILYFLLTNNHLDRERYSDERYDLVRVTGDPQLEYVTEGIFPYSIIEAPPEKRVPARHLGETAQKILKLIEEHYYPGTIGSRCRFCGQGTYVGPELKSGLQGDRSSSLNVFPVRIIVCNNCGHVAMFTR